MMVNDVEVDKGKCEPSLEGAGARVLREIIRTPAFREIIKVHSTKSDSDHSAQLIQTFLWEDINFSLGLMGVCPDRINNLTTALVELGKQLNTFPPELLDQFVLQLLSDIDSKTLKEVPATWAPVLERILIDNPQVRQMTADGFYNMINGSLDATCRILEKLLELDAKISPPASNTIDPAGLGKAITLSAKIVNRNLEKNPEFLKELFSNICIKEVAKLVFALSGAMIKAIFLLPFKALRSFSRHK